MLGHAIKLHLQEPFDVVHAHDWLAIQAAWVLKDVFKTPLVSTMHATEHGRNGGIHEEIQQRIHSLEWRTTFESDEVIVNSRFMYDAVKELFELPEAKLTVVPNGIHADRLASDADRAELRRQHGLSAHQPMILFVGRLVHEKGVQVAIEAMPKILSQHPDTVFMIAGDGTFRESLQQLVDQLGIAGSVQFYGMADDDGLSALYRMADVVVIPSRKEPFGLVALEGMANYVPVVTSNTGGLVEIVEHMHTGVHTFVDQADSLAWGVLQVLNNEALAESLKVAARQAVLDRFTWPAIARQTLAVYQRACQSAR